MKRQTDIWERHTETERKGAERQTEKQRDRDTSERHTKRAKAGRDGETETHQRDMQRQREEKGMVR